MTDVPGHSTDDTLHKLYALIEEADNSGSESDEFVRGMRFLFDALAAATVTPAVKTTSPTMITMPASASQVDAPSKLVASR